MKYEMVTIRRDEYEALMRDSANLHILIEEIKRSDDKITRRLAEIEAKYANLGV